MRHRPLPASPDDTIACKTIKVKLWYALDDFFGSQHSILRHVYAHRRPAAVYAIPTDGVAGANWLN